MIKIIVAAAFLAAFAANAGPFGLSKGMTLSEIEKQGEFTPTDQKFIYEATKITSAHPDFESYTVIITPEQGLCKIQALSKDIATGQSGTELQGNFKSLVDTLSEKYGVPGKNFNYLRHGSIWKAPQDWMIGLLQKDRTLTAYWNKSDNKKNIDSINVISVQTLGISRNTGFLKLSYEFDNFDACVKVLQATTNSNL